MRNTPNDCTDTEIEALALMAEEHPVYQPNPETILGNRPRGLQTIHVPADMPLIELARAFASIGYTLRGARGDLVAVPMPSSADVLNAVQRSGTGRPGSIEEC